MLTALRQVGRKRMAPLTLYSRCYATETSLSASSDSSSTSDSDKQRQYEKFLAMKAKEPPSRPQLRIKTDENHGLYAFFRKVPVEGGSETVYETVEASNKGTTKLGRSWNAVELRRKSFKDLHTLWYVTLRERNLIATQRAEAKRLGVIDEFLDIKDKDSRCRKTMARIKQILNERRIAYEQAHAIAYGEALIQEQAEATTQAPQPPLTVAASPVTQGRRLRRGRTVSLTQPTAS